MKQVQKPRTGIHFSPRTPSEGLGQVDFRVKICICRPNSLRARVNSTKNSRWGIIYIIRRSQFQFHSLLLG